MVYRNQLASFVKYVVLVSVRVAISDIQKCHLLEISETENITTALTMDIPLLVWNELL